MQALLSFLVMILSHLATISRFEYSQLHMLLEINDVYPLENFPVEAMTWYDYWSALTQKPANINDVLLKTNFYPANKDALIILVTLPATTCTVERSFSTVRRVNTWLRSMGNERLSRLYMSSVHKEEIKKNKQRFIGRVVDKFGEDRKRLQVLFNNEARSSSA